MQINQAQSHSPVARTEYDEPAQGFDNGHHPLAAFHATDTNLGYKVAAPLRASEFDLADLSTSELSIVPATAGLRHPS